MCAQIIIEEVVGSPEGSTPDSWPLQMMTKDQYANYVVQKMLEVNCTILLHSTCFSIQAVFDAFSLEKLLLVPALLMLLHALQHTSEQHQLDKLTQLVSSGPVDMLEPMLTHKYAKQFGSMAAIFAHQLYDCVWQCTNFCADLCIMLTPCCSAAHLALLS